ncbi:MAG: LytR/AlgR family response regulator transcription factor [Crocinitomicaceae bacterium]
MRALVIEDKAYVRKGLISLLKIVEFDIEIVGECESVKDAVIVTKACKPELIFLDINLLDGSAFDFLSQTEDLSFKVIFITAYEEYALKALKAGAVDYILKPVDIQDLTTALNKVNNLPIETQKRQVNTAKAVYTNDHSKLVLSLHDSFQVIDLNELMYCESDKGYTTFYCSNNKRYVVSKTLKEYDERLVGQNFVRAHQSYLVNLAFVDRYEKAGAIHLKNGQKLPVSMRKKDHFISEFLKWSNS